MTTTTHALLPHHARELFEESGIDPTVAAERGYRSVSAAECAAFGFAPYQCGDGLLLPQWTLAGVQRGHKLKRDTPRTDDHGKTIKYEFPAGAPPAFDVHPRVRRLLLDPSVPVYFTEGIKKADAGVSRGALFVDIGSVWMFLNGRLVVPDLDDILLDDRPVRVVFDSDVTRKPSVAEALLRFCAALRRRGARVEVVYLPPGPDAAKTGVDDFFVGGGTLANLDALAQPWTGDGPGVWLQSGGEEDADELRRKLDQAREDNRALIRAIVNPEVTRQQLVAVTSSITYALAKQQRGEVAPNGGAVLSAAEIADDWRPAPAKGERITPTNPSGGRPRLARERVKPILVDAIARGLVAAKPRPIRRTHANGSIYTDTEWIFDPIPSIAAALSPWGAYRPAEPVARKPRASTAPCPHCGEVHPIRRLDACTGCGAIRSDKTIDARAATASDNLSEAKTTDSSPPPPPHVELSDNLSEASAERDETPLAEPPVWLDQAPDPTEPDGFDGAADDAVLLDVRSPLAGVAAERAAAWQSWQRGRPDPEPNALESGAEPPWLAEAPQPTDAPAWLPGFVPPPPSVADRYTQ